MSKGLFDLISKLRPLAKEGKITRDEALEMLQGSGATSAQMETAAQNLFRGPPAQASGIISLEKGADLVKASEKATEPTRVSDNFDTILNNLGTLEELNDESLQALARESKVLGNSIKQLENMRDNSEEYVLMTNRKKKIDGILDVANMIPRSKNTSFEDSLESWKRANKDRSLLISTREEEKFMNERFDYERAQYQQALQKKLQPFYEKYGAKTKEDKKFIEDFYDVDVDEGATLKKNNSSYMFVDVRTYLDEATENILGMSKDLRTDILYGREASKYVNSQDIKGFIKYAKQRFMDEGVAINDKMLNKVVDDMYIIDDAFATGGRVGFKKGLSKALIDKLNEIAPGSTKVGGLSKEMSEKALRQKAERELREEFNRFNTENPPSGVEKGTIKVDPSEYPVDFEKNKFIPKAGKGRFTKAQVLEQILKNTIRDLGNDSEVGEYIKEVFPKLLKEIQDDPLKANNENVFRNLTTQLVDNPKQRLVVYDDDTVDFFTKGERRGMEGARKIAEEFNISMEEAAKISTMDPEDQVLELTKMRALKNRKLNANGGLNYLMGLD